MSHAATSWAVRGAIGLGLSAGAKLVLFQLADRHNPDHGCFPSQDRLTADCEVSRSQLNVHLASLEAAGLIRRVRQVDQDTRKRKATRYLFAFEEGFTPVQTKAANGPEQVEMPLGEEKPCPEIGHGKSDETMSGKSENPCPISKQSHVRPTGHKPVREPVREPIVRGDAAEHTDRRFTEFWQVYPRARNKARSQQIFTEAVDRGVDPSWIIASAKQYRAENKGNKPMYLVYSDNWLEAERWRDYDQPGQKRLAVTVPPGPDLATMFAEKIKAGCYVAPSAITPRLASEIIGRGLATEAVLRSAGFQT